MRLFLVGLFIQAIITLAYLPKHQAEVAQRTSLAEGETIEKRIHAKILSLKEKHPSLGEMVLPGTHSYHVEWVLDEPGKLCKQPGPITRKPSPFGKRPLALITPPQKWGKRTLQGLMIKKPARWKMNLANCDAIRGPALHPRGF